MHGMYLGGAFEVDETSIFNWESNRVEPAVRLIPVIIRFLGYCPYEPALPAAEWLKLIRRSLGLSQDRMADMIRVAEGTWKRWEAGQRQPAPEYVGRIKAFLNGMSCGQRTRLVRRDSPSTKPCVKTTRPPTVPRA